jgi:hypothetical protein
MDTELSELIEPDRRPLPADPADMGWPPTFPIEVALYHADKSRPIRKICEGNDISSERWNEIRANPAFIVEVAAAFEALKKDGMQFKTRAGLQALALLDTSWDMTQDKSGETPASVRADLIKFTIRCAGLDASQDPAILGKQNAMPSFHINIDLGKDDDERMVVIEHKDA